MPNGRGGWIIMGTVLRALICLVAALIIIAAPLEYEMATGDHASSRLLNGLAMAAAWLAVYVIWSWTGRR